MVFKQFSYKYEVVPTTLLKIKKGGHHTYSFNHHKYPMNLDIITLKVNLFKLIFWIS